MRTIYTAFACHGTVQTPKQRFLVSYSAGVVLCETGASKYFKLLYINYLPRLVSYFFLVTIIQFVFITFVNAIATIHNKMKYNN